MRIVTAFFGVFILTTVGSASAQTLSDAAQIARPDDTVIVTDLSGHKEKGHLVSISPESVRLLSPQPVDIPVERVSRIEKVGDPIQDGFRKGAIVGGVFGALTGAAVLRRQDAILFVPMVFTGAVEMGVVGLVFDAMHISRRTVYRATPGAPVRLTLAPVVTPQAKGVAVRLSF